MNLYHTRQQALREHLKQNQLDAILVFSLENLRYLTGYSGEAAYGLISQSESFLITDYRFMEQAERECNNTQIICRDRKKQSLGEAIAQLCSQEKISALAFESAHITVQMWQSISDALSNVKISELNGLVETARMRKDAHEIESMRSAAAIADKALANLLPQFKEGVSERDMALELEFQMLRQGSEGLSFPTIMLFAERSSLPHGIPGDKKLQRGDIILIDFGAVQNGYRSDMTRSYIFGEANQQQHEVYHLVLQAQQNAIETLTAGVSTNIANEASQQVLTQSDYAQYAGEGLGHGVGLYLHEQPLIGMGPEHVLEAGNIITIEPGIYIPDWGGIRLEDDMLITENGCEYLTHSPKPFELDV
ncbi:Xaa-Pro peptidase family protein [Pleionea sp. CnH1-48]|uniref:M24 family metallopeptidase n=1 Tax=Pleionea sp. CnH1-48 TaxID=2954494 RepID=UPI002097EF67|nr:Xaa-Pro peptidase family protein [Pleionea sp. CnH1-48]MCO7227367.1 Xaa-Pro peptidase family protein [Pleionea sp. CnH1-48]